MTGSFRASRLAPLLVATAAAGLVLGPALGRGVVLAYDLAWSPDPRLTPFVTGAGTPAPRAVPSDAVAVLLGALLTAPVAQKLVLLAILVGAGLGAAALLTRLRPTAGPWAACATVVLAEWNPYVAERLLVGQWTVLLGYAVLPWALRAALRARSGDRGGAAACAGWVALSGAGGANTVVVVAGSVVLVLLVRPVRVRPLAAALATGAGACAAWALPALVAAPPSSRVGATAFAPRPDTPLGTALSLVSGGGFWNPAAVPAARAHGIPALAATVLAVACLAAAVVLTRRPRGGRTLWVPAVAGLTVAVLSSVPAFSPAWASLVTDLPGGGVLRDSQKLVAPWVVLMAVGAGGLVVAARERLAPVELGVVAAVGVVLLPVAVLPTLAWGGSGRLHAVAVPGDYRAGARLLSGLPRGEVGLLPWNQYRRYAWNGSRVSLTLLPRIVDQRVLFDDALPLASGSVPGEDPRAAAVSRSVAAGVPPVEALRRAGVTYVAVERRGGLDATVPPGSGRVVHDGPSLLILQVGPAAGGPDPGLPMANLLGWGLTLLTWVVVGAWCVVRRSTWRRQPGLLGFGP